MNQALYEYFNKRLDDKIRSYGESRMERDVARLRALNEQLYDKCVLKDTSSSKDVQLDKDMRPYNGDTVAYSIRYCHITSDPLIEYYKKRCKQQSVEENTLKTVH